MATDKSYLFILYEALPLVRIMQQGAQSRHTPNKNDIFNKSRNWKYYSTIDKSSCPSRLRFLFSFKNRHLME